MQKISLAIIIIFMHQTLNFTEAVKLLYYGISITKESSADSIYNQLSSVCDKRVTTRKVSSLSASIDLGSDAGAIQTRNRFYFLKPSLEKLKIDTATIEMTIVETNMVKKITEIELNFECKDKADAYKTFDELNNFFMPLSTLSKTEVTEDGKGKISQFSTKSENTFGIRDITILLFQFANSSSYQIRILPYNEFSE
jgi:hypothetical protein